MSYILDALKKAEAQRTLGALPNIHAPAVFTAATGHRAPLWRRAWRWGAPAALLALLGALAWLRPWQIAPSPPPAPVPAPAAIPAAPAPAPLIAPAPPVPLAPPASAPRPPAARDQKAKTAAHSVPLALAQPKQKPTVAAAPPAKKPAAPEEAPEAELQTLRDLPPQVQSEIPPLVISGSLYSSNRAERSLLINNQLLHEGDTVAPGLILEKIQRGAAVLNYQGYRYRMSY